MKTLAFALLLFLISVSAGAQTCTGSLGEPIINYTFGTSATNPAPALSAGSTDLQYSPTTCPNDGQYTIANYTTNCFNAWVTLTDHTGDVNGCYMLVNASIQPSVFYIDTIDNLCGDVTYQFGAWIVNVVASNGYIEPNLTFAIRSPSGTILQNNNTGNIPVSAGQWNYYSFNFTTSGTTSVILSITNNAPGGSGNDLAIDDISLRSVGPGIDVGIQGYATDTVYFCNTIPALTLTSQVDPCYSTTFYQWQLSSDSGLTWADIAGATGLTYSPLASSAGAYLYRMAAAGPGNINNAQCRVLSSVIAVYCDPGPSVLLSPKDTTVCPGQQVVFTASGADTYQWSDFTQGPQKTVTVFGSSMYIVTANNSGLACTAVDTAYAHVYVPVTPVITQQSTGPCASDTMLLSATGGVSYLWSNGVTSPTLSIFPVTDATFTVTATDANGCTATASVVTAAHNTWSISSSVVEPPCPVRNIGTIDLIANGDSAQLHYLWSTGDSASHLGSLGPGSYSVTVSDSSGCLTSFTFVLAYSYTLQVSISPGDTSLPIGSLLPLQLTSNVNNGNQYAWYPTQGLSCTDCAAPIAHIDSSSSTYIATVTDQNGCEATDSIRITTVDTASTPQLPYIYIPNAFTPNGDGANDLFQIFGTGAALDAIRFFSVKIFDRWGELVFESQNPAFKWSGVYKSAPLPPDVYVYLIDYLFAGNTTGRLSKGSVTLIR